MRISCVILIACGLVFLAACADSGQKPSASRTTSSAPLSDSPETMAGSGTKSKSVVVTQSKEESTSMTEKIVKTEEEWRKSLTPEQYRILREAGTERAFTGEYWKTKTPGVYRCAACGQPLFESDDKFDSGTGWPSFTEPAAPGSVEQEADNSLGMVRTEVLCSRCGSHLGHVFPDGPEPTGLRYCINSACLKLDPANADKDTTKEPK